MSIEWTDINDFALDDADGRPIWLDFLEVFNQALVEIRIGSKVWIVFWKLVAFQFLCYILELFQLILLVSYEVFVLIFFGGFVQSLDLLLALLSVDVWDLERPPL